MRPKESHISDDELLLAADGELSAQQTKECAEHLVACWDCRARKTRVEATIAGLVETRHALFDPQLTPAAGRRALLKVRLSHEADERSAHWYQAFISLAFRNAIMAGLVVILLVALTTVAVRRWSTHTGSTILAQGPVEPSRVLTPGATRHVDLREVCGRSDNDTRARVIPAPLQRQVFKEYGIEGIRAQDYEVDFLITPELGGANDIQNLWPEAYHSPVWNAHVKDELEDRLHQMVCSGEIDLRTAQQDISADWISAYKKYFHSDRPL
jgi:hypothetical protein